MKLKKLAVLFAAVVLSSAVFAGCGSKTDTADVKPQDSSETPVTQGSDGAGEPAEAAEPTDEERIVKSPLKRRWSFARRIRRKYSAARIREAYA